MEVSATLRYLIATWLLLAEMDARKASSLSATSDGSDSSLHSVMNLVLEQIGLISLLPESEQTEKTNRSVKISSSGNFISALLGEVGD